MSSSSPSGISTKTIGLLAAGLLAIVFTIIIWTSISSTPAPITNPNDFFPDDMAEEIPNIEDTQTGGAMLVTMVDKDDPTRVAATLKADRFEPIGDGRRRLDNPESWIFLQDGRAMKITADFATMLMPDPNQPPESGTLEGNILIQSFESTTATDPTLTATFEEPLEFERRYLRLRSPGPFNISSSAFEFAGADLTLILNELRDRVELIDVARGDHIVIHNNAKNTQPNAESESESAVAIAGSPESTPQTTNSPLDTTRPVAQQANQVSDTPPATNAPKTTDPIADILTRYHIVLNDQVVASASDSGTANADHLELWVALQDGNLPDNAIKQINFAPTESSPTETPEHQSEVPAPQRNEPATSPNTNTNNELDVSTDPSTDIVITWAGKMTLRPIDGESPKQLQENALALQLTADEDSGITFDIPNQSFTGKAFSATYLATQGIIELESKQTQAGIIKLIAQDAGTLNATSLAANLATGEIKLDRRGSIETTPQRESEPDSKATIQWSNSAAFTLALDSSTGALTNRLTRAIFDGSVIARQDGNTVGARVLDAGFDPSRPSVTSLQTIDMIDGVLSSASRSIISGNELLVNLAPSVNEDSITPTKLTATGNVLARTPEQMLKSEHLIVDMSQDLAGKIIIETASAEGSIRYTDSQRSTAQGETLDADVINETMTLLGSPAKVGQGGSTVIGDHINLNARRRGIEVIGPGSFDHDIALNPSTENTAQSATGHIRATWKGSMRFDDAIGTIICTDQVKVISTPDAYTRDTLDAHRAEIKLTPSPSRDPIAGNNKTKTDDRSLLNARVFGRAPTGQSPAPAKIESRTYDQLDPERVIGLIYLEGPQILVDNQAQTLQVPAPGTLLIMDRSEGEQTESTSDSSALASNSGLTRFTWVGKMNLNRAQGTANFTNQVAVRQKTLSTGKIASLMTDQLDARFEIGQQDQDQSTRLLGIDATGSVRFLYEGKELLADSAIYDAVSDSLFASAIDNKLVTLYDNTRPAPLSAKTMRWALEQDRIEINAPTPTRSTGN